MCLRRSRQLPCAIDKCSKGGGRIHLKKMFLFQLMTKLVEILHCGDVQQVPQVIVAQAAIEMSVSCTSPPSMVVDQRGMYNQGVNYEDVSNVVWGAIVESARARAHQLLSKIHCGESAGESLGVEARVKRRRRRPRVGGPLRIVVKGDNGSEAASTCHWDRSQGCRRIMTGRRRVAQGLSGYANLVSSRSAISRLLCGSCAALDNR